MKFERRPSPASRAAATSADLERKRKAEEIATRSGIPVQMAYSVVDGHTTLDAVLKGMLAREKTKRLIEQHGLTPSLAGQVARGQISLDKVLARFRRRSSAQWRAKFSVFDDLVGKSVGLLRFAQDWTLGTITQSAKYDFGFDSGSGSETFFKHEVKLIVVNPEGLDQAKAVIGQEPEVRSQGLSFTANLDERLKLDKERFFDAIKANVPLRFVFRDGDVLEGPIQWFSRYEFALPIGDRNEVVGFFHALLEWTVPEQVPAAAAAKDNKKKDHPKDHKKDHHSKDHKKGKKGRR